MSGNFSRRDLLKLGAASAGALALPPTLSRAGVLGPGGAGHLASRSGVIGGTLEGPYAGPYATVAPFSVDLPIPKLAERLGSLPPPTKPLSGGFPADAGDDLYYPPGHTPSGTDYFELRQKQANVQILPGYPSTPVWAYFGQDADGREAMNPTIEVHQDHPALVRQYNDLVEPVSTHLHGSATASRHDGYANWQIQPGTFWDYVYPNFQESRLLWYHDHAVHKTARHVYQGLAASYILRDDWEEDLELPKGYAEPKYDATGGLAGYDGHEVPLMIGDKSFTPEGNLVFNDRGHDSFMGRITLVNGAPWPRMRVEPRRYRFRVLLGSNSRNYRLALSNGAPFIVLGSDAGFMYEPVQVKSLLVGMAERYDLVVDFASAAGKSVVLQNLAANGAMRNVMRFDVDATGPADDSWNFAAMKAHKLRPAPLPAQTPTPGTPVRRLHFKRSKGMWTVDGKIWDPGRVDYLPRYDTTEVWEFFNDSGGWFHPIHVHLVDFQILTRNNRPARPHERGMKDVAYVGENELVRVVMKFEHHRGKYMIHCHNTVHEDFDMMSQFQVV